MHTWLTLPLPTKYTTHKKCATTSCKQGYIKERRKMATMAECYGGGGGGGWTRKFEALLPGLLESLVSVLCSYSSSAALEWVLNTKKASTFSSVLHFAASTNPLGVMYSWCKLPSWHSTRTQEKPNRSPCIIIQNSTDDASSRVLTKHIVWPGNLRWKARIFLTKPSSSPVTWSHTGASQTTLNLCYYPCIRIFRLIDQ